MSNRTVGVLVGLTIPVAVALGVIVGNPWIAWAIVVAGLALGLKEIPGFWRTTLRSLLAGTAAGLLVLGPGLRIAMRVAAIVDPVKHPEFTIGGTVFIVVGLGAIMGGAAVGAVMIIVRALSLPRWGGVLVITIVMGGVLFGDSEIISEITGLGAGPWMNVPMFGGVVVAFAILADRWARPLQPVSDTLAPVDVETLAMQ